MKIIKFLRVLSKKLKNKAFPMNFYETSKLNVTAIALKVNWPVPQLNFYLCLLRLQYNHPLVGEYTNSFVEITIKYQLKRLVHKSESGYI
jgi:hypothetical protein